MVQHATNSETLLSPMGLTHVSDLLFKIAALMSRLNCSVMRKWGGLRLPALPVPDMTHCCHLLLLDGVLPISLSPLLPERESDKPSDRRWFQLLLLFLHLNISQKWINVVNVLCFEVLCGEIHMLPFIFFLKACHFAHAQRQSILELGWL